MHQTWDENAHNTITRQSASNSISNSDPGLCRGCGRKGSVDFSTVACRALNLMCPIAGKDAEDSEMETVMETVFIDLERSRTTHVVSTGD